MVSSILLLCTDPDGFFLRDPKEWSGLKIPAVIVLFLVTLVTSGVFS